MKSNKSAATTAVRTDAAANTDNTAGTSSTGNEDLAADQDGSRQLVTVSSGVEHAQYSSSQQQPGDEINEYLSISNIKYVYIAIYIL